jgi:hypothetical protein
VCVIRGSAHRKPSSSPEPCLVRKLWIRKPLCSKLALVGLALFWRYAPEVRPKDLAADALSAKIELGRAAIALAPDSLYRQPLGKIRQSMLTLVEASVELPANVWLGLCVKTCGDHLEAERSSSRRLSQGNCLQSFVFEPSVRLKLEAVGEGRSPREQSPRGPQGFQNKNGAIGTVKSQPPSGERDP